MTISFLVAVSENNVIGKNNQLPWHLPADLKYFKNLTWAMPIVMGRKTYESIGRPLPGRTNIVLTRNKEWKAAGVQTIQSIDEALTIAKAQDIKEIFVIGGAEIFNSTMQQASRIYLTRIHHSFEGDVFFPILNRNEWELINNRECVPDEKNKYACSYQVWEKFSERE